MKQFKLLILLLVIGFVGEAQINYLPMNSRYRWIAGKFDSTLHIPFGTTPSLRTGGHTGSGALFYKTSDSSVYVYTGTQWIKMQGTNIDTSAAFVTSLIRRSDSVFYKKGATYTFAFKDSTGGGASDTSVFLVDTLYNRIATTINTDSLRLKSLLIMHGTDTAAAVATDSTLKITVPKIDTASLSTRINAKVDTSAVVVFDTTGAVTGYELYIDRTGADTIKTRAATGGGSSGAFAKLEWFSGDENAPATGDSTMVNDSFSAKYLDVYRNGIKQPHIVGDTGWARVNDSTIKVIPYFADNEFWHIEARDSSSYTQLTLQAPSTPPSTTIAYVSSADGGNNSSSTTSKTFAFNVSSGTDRYLVVGFVGDVSSGADDVSSVTYNGVAMTLLCKTTNPSGGRWNYLYGLANPASGNNNVVITFSSTHWIICGAAEYSGVQGVDVTNTNSTAVSTLTTTSTTTANNAWGIIFAGAGGGAGTLNAGSGCTKRTTSSMGYWALFDSNGAVTPAGSHSMTTTYSAGSNVSHTVVYLKPY